MFIYIIIDFINPSFSFFVIYLIFWVFIFNYLVLRHLIHLNRNLRTLYRPLIVIDILIKWTLNLHLRVLWLSLRFWIVLLAAYELMLLLRIKHMTSRYLSVLLLLLLTLQICIIINWLLHRILLLPIVHLILLIIIILL